MLVFAFSACESIEVPAVGLQVDVHRHPLGGGVHAYTYIENESNIFWLLNT